MQSHQYNKNPEFEICKTYCEENIQEHATLKPGEKTKQSKKKSI